MESLRTILFSVFCFGMAITLKAERVDMLKSGAKADGKTLNTTLINHTVDRLSQAGGGTLFFPAGTYLTGAIRLKSNITLELEAGATLLFSDNFDDYLPFMEVRHEGVMPRTSQSKGKGHSTVRERHGGRNFSVFMSIWRKTVCVS